VARPALDCLLEERLGVGILLGAGSSVAAGFPSTQQITNRVLSGQGVTRHTDSSYYFSDGAEPLSGLVLLVRSMVRRLHAESERYFSAYAGRSANYEDAYYLARQASDELSGEIDNPAIRMFVKELQADMSLLISATNERKQETNEPDELGIPVDIGKLLQETCNYIESIVSKSLVSHSPSKQSTRQLEVIRHACESTNITGISTLCHDTHVEEFLKTEGVRLSDGFPEHQDAPQWNGEFSGSETIPFLKLHGSVNWYRYLGDKIRRVPSGCYPQQLILDGGTVQYLEKGPLLLVGTFNKISDYSSGIFRDLHHHFRSTLRKASIMIMCGYGFGDKGINSEIIDWCFGGEGRRFVIIHQDPDDLIANARGAIRKHWDEWRDKGLISIIEKRFEDAEVADLEGIISCSANHRASTQ